MSRPFRADRSTACHPGRCPVLVCRAPAGLSPLDTPAKYRASPRLTVHLLPTLALASICLVLTAPAVRAADAAAGAATFQKECAGCHGPDAHGGKDGEYPRLAGLPPGYLVGQIKDFRDLKRANKPMLPIFKAGRLSTDQITDLAAYLSALPVPEPGQVGVPPVNEGDLALGEELYVRDCSLCHGLAGEGKPGTDNPPLRAQWPAYLKRQLADLRGGRRGHEYREALFQETEPDELAAILAWVLRLNRLGPVGAASRRDATACLAGLSDP